MKEIPTHRSAILDQTPIGAGALESDAGRRVDRSWAAAVDRSPWLWSLDPGWVLSPR